MAEISVPSALPRCACGGRLSPRSCKHLRYRPGRHTRLTEISNSEGSGRAPIAQPLRGTRAALALRLCSGGAATLETERIGRKRCARSARRRMKKIFPCRRRVRLLRLRCGG
ncbi:MAG: hypothetical protein D6788_01730 [Planctomycetota bacterium]|nr:MAG: hypothetical protein D6788_01730 [Planctomycetota bacterium]